MPALHNVFLQAALAFARSARLRLHIRFILNLCRIRRSTHYPRGVSEPPAKAGG